MPRIVSSDSDESPAFDICPDFTGGQASAPRANLLNQNQAALLVNMDFDSMGVTKTRRGTRAMENYTTVSGTADIIRGGITVNLPDNRVVTLAYNGSLYYRLASNASATAIFTGGTGVFSRKKYVATAHGATGAYYADGENLLGFCDGQAYYTIPNAPIGSLLAWHTNRLFISGIPGRPHTIRASGILDTKQWNSAFFSIDVGTNDGDKIVAIQPWQDNFLIVFKSKSIWAVNCDPTSTNSAGILSASGWVIKNISYNYGCVAPRSVAVVGDDVWFLAQDSVRAISRLANTEAQIGLDDAKSAPIRDYVRRFNRDASNEAVGIVFEGYYFLALPLDGSPTNTTTLVFRDTVNAWLGTWTLTPTCFIYDTIYSPTRLLLGMSDSTLREWLSYYQDYCADPSVFQDAGVGVQSTILSRAMIFGEIMSPKKGHAWRAEFFQSTSASTALSAAFDSGTAQTLSAVDTRSQPGVTLPTNLPWTLPTRATQKRASSLSAFDPFDEMQVQIVNTDLLPLSVRYVSASAFVEPMKLET